MATSANVFRVIQDTCITGNRDQEATSNSGQPSLLCLLLILVTLSNEANFVVQNQEATVTR